MTRKIIKTPLIISPMQEPSQANCTLNVIPCSTSQKCVESVLELGKVLSKIHNRLLSEGYCIILDRIIDPHGTVIYEKPKRHRKECFE